jgi:hypothetical protein
MSKLQNLFSKAANDTMREEMVIPNFKFGLFDPRSPTSD